MAGRDTTAHALTWMFYLIYHDNSDESIQTTLVQEVDDVLGGSIPMHETLKNLKFAEAWYDHISRVPLMNKALISKLTSMVSLIVCIMIAFTKVGVRQILYIHVPSLEKWHGTDCSSCDHLFSALRIFPPVPRNLRYCIKDDILPDGNKVYAGEWVAWSSYVMGRSESVWGPDAKEFRPSHWINSVKPSLGKFNSFGLGPRACPSQHYVTIQVLTVIGMILQHFDVKLEEPSKVPTYATSFAFPMINSLKIRVSRCQL